MYRLTETTPPASEPLTLEEAKIFLRVDQDADDDLIEALISAARQLCEAHTGRALITRSCSLFLDAWPHNTRALDLPLAPLAAVSAVKVYEKDGSSVTLAAADYFVDTIGARLVLTSGATVPTPGRVANGIEIQFTAGYGDDEADVPPLLRQGILQLVAHLYEHRGDSPDQAVSASGAAALLRPYRRMSLA